MFLASLTGLVLVRGAFCLLVHMTANIDGIIETQPQITMFDLDIAPDAITDGLPDLGATCRRCKHTNVDVWPVTIIYPGTYRHLDCCTNCKSEIKVAFDRALEEAGLCS